MRYLSLLIVAAISTASFADVLVLKDGTRLDGDVKKGDSGYVVTQANGTFQVIPFDIVKSLELRASDAPPDIAKENLASLRRSVEHDDNLFRIIGRYKQFIARVGDESAAEQAKQDLAIWQQAERCGHDQVRLTMGDRCGQGQVERKDDANRRCGAAADEAGAFCRSRIGGQSGAV